MRISFFIAVSVALVGSILIGLPIGHLILSVLPMGAPFIAKLAIGLMLGVLYVVWVYHNTPTKHRSAVFLFNNYRVRFGPEWKGFEEGLNATPLGWPFMMVVDKSVAEKTVDFEQTAAYTSDNIIAQIDGTYQVYIDDLYNTYNIEEPEPALKSLILRSVRSAVEHYTAVELIREDKETLSNNILGKVKVELASGSAQWGLMVTDILRVNHIRLPSKFEEALQKVEQEKVEGIYEQTQAGRRRAQVEELTKMGIRPDVAYAGSLIDAEKPGSSMQNITIHGLEAMGPLADDIGALGRSLSNLVSGKTTKKGGKK